jgi:hypothetical protein
MSLRPVLLCALALSACAHSPPEKAAVSSTFVKRPSKAPGCDFEVFEEREPPRPYGVLGKLPMRTNEWTGVRGRKALLADSVCRAGADAVILPRPVERRLVNERVRDYEALFIVWTDVAAPRAEDEELPPLPVNHGPPPSPEDGYILVPVGPEWPGDTIGTQERPLTPIDETR